MNRDSVRPSVESIPGPRAQQWIDYHRTHAAPSTYAYDFVWDVTAESIGPFCKDPDGNVFLDFTSHVGASPLGYNHPELLAKTREFDLVDPIKIAGQDFYLSTGPDPDRAEAPTPAHLMDKVTDLTDQYGFDTVFLSNSGAEAVENALKICYASRDTTKYGITFEGAFHGRTLGALSVTRSKSEHRRGYPELSGIQEIQFSETGVRDLERKLDADSGHVAPSDVAFLILEPVQGEGGFNLCPSAFFDRLNALCQRHDIPVIVDEIQSGLGRTGEFWAVDHYELEPDVITSAKGLRVGATIGSSDLFPDEPNRLSSTWGAGDILASLVGTLTLSVIEEEQLVSNASERGAGLLGALRDLEANHELIVDVRGVGLMAALELRTKSLQQQVIAAALERGLLTLGCGHKTVRLLPPLTVTEREISLGIELLDEALRAVE